MFIHYDFRDMLEDSIYGWLSVDLWFLMKIFEMIEEISFNIIMCLQPFSLLILDSSNVIMHSSLYCGAMK